MQYALHERAVALGWHDSDIAVVDADLGLSGASTEQRVGYQELVAEIALGTVGILLAYDATRLARNCTHWYQLLDLCGRFDCLIADRDGVYDPTSINGRLLLGLKGQISELELHTIRARLNAGILSKASRGELGLQLPTGLLRPEPGIVVKHPDLEIQQRIDLIFRMMLEKKSIAVTTRSFRENNLLIPRQDAHRSVHWKTCTADTMRRILTNPAYAGAAVYGRSCMTTSKKTGKKQPKQLPHEKWKFCVHDKFPAYVSWEVFQSIQTMIQDNHNEYKRKNNRGMPAELIEQLKSIGVALPELWKSGLLKMSQKKKLLRSVIDKVVVTRSEGDQASVRVVWRGGAATTGVVSLSVGKMAALSSADEMSAKIVELARNGDSDQSIAQQLTQVGYRSPRSTKVLQSTVSRIRLSHGILQSRGRSCPRRVPGFLTVSELAKKLGVSVAWIHNRIGNGTIKVKKDQELNCYLFPDTPETLTAINHVLDEPTQISGFSMGHQDA